MDKRVNLYFFGEIGVYDEYCPTYVCNKKFATEILYLIAKNRPFNISKEEIMTTLNISLNAFEEIINELEKIDLIHAKNNYYKINFPIFLEKDLGILDENLNNIGKVISDVIIKNREFIYNKICKISSYSYFTTERLLYHVICDYIFDGNAFNYFNEKGLFSISKIHPGDRNYIAIGYEDSEVVESYSNKLLCSSNNFKSYSFIFNSFGDSNGQRKDVYRFFRMTQKSLKESTREHDLNLAYMKIIDNQNKEIIEECGQLILRILNSKISFLELTENEKNLANFLKGLNYISFDKNKDIISIEVPVFTEFDRRIINEISKFLLDEIFEIVRQMFIEFEKTAKELTSIQHRVSIKEILNELWHQIFGVTNEYLVEKGFIATPKNVNGEGRYLRSLSININLD